MVKFLIYHYSIDLSEKDEIEEEMGRELLKNGKSSKNR
jgi:hypothetical protein